MQKKSWMNNRAETAEQKQRFQQLVNSEESESTGTKRDFFNNLDILLKTLRFSIENQVLGVKTFYNKA